MQVAGFPWWRGSTLLIRKTIWSSSTPCQPTTKQSTILQLIIKTSTVAYQESVIPITDTNSPCGASPIRPHDPVLSVRSHHRRGGPGGVTLSLPLVGPTDIIKAGLAYNRTATQRYTQTFRCFSSNSYRDQVLTALRMGKVVVIGISGITNGGKTTLCERLEKDLPMATHINMDDYFFESDSGRIPLVEELNHGNYEDVRAIDFESMVNDVDDWVVNAAEKSVRGNPKILFLEGILIFNYPPLVKYFSLKYFLTLTKEQCWDRRKHRSYDPPDPPNYFDMVVWPMYLKNKADIQNQSNIVYVDGMDSPDKTYWRILTDIKAQLED